MARAATRAEPVRLRPVQRPAFGGGPPPTGVASPPISNGQLAMLVLIAFEIMVFVGLVTAYCVLRVGSFAWPPPNLPHLPLAVTWVNTVMLLFSAFTMWRAAVAVRHDNQAGLRSALVATAVLGTGFLAVQGSEWVRLIRQGLTLSSGSYGSTFYTLIGLHAVHVVAAVVWLLAVLAIAQRNGFTAKRHLGVTMCAMYWYFVCVLWAFLFVVVYLV
jgi:heme/copper-type cytochrome/quinol oxidase subunit 3